MKIEKSTLQFLQDLSENNDRDWFHSQKNIYEEARNNVLAFTESLMQKLYPDLANYDPKKSIFRIHRDIRFSKDKTPYKTHFGVVLHPAYRKTSKPALYLQVNKNGGLLAAGQWMPSKIELENLRQEIDYSEDEFGSILKKIDKDFTLDESSKLKRPPKGYEKDNPNIEWIKLKNFVVSQNFDKNQITDTELQNKILKQKQKLKPFIEFLERAQI